MLTIRDLTDITLGIKNLVTPSKNPLIGTLNLKTIVYPDEMPLTPIQECSCEECEIRHLLHMPTQFDSCHPPKDDICQNCSIRKAFGHLCFSCIERIEYKMEGLTSIVRGKHSDFVMGEFFRICKRVDDVVEFNTTNSPSTRQICKLTFNTFDTIQRECTELLFKK